MFQPFMLPKLELKDMFRNWSGYPNESSNFWEAIAPIAIQAHCFLHR